MVKVRRRIQKIEYEGIHVICFAYGEVGHRSENCRKILGCEDNQTITESQSEGGNRMKTSQFAPKESEVVERFGPWIMVRRR